MDSTKPFPFMELPKEIRFMVYERIPITTTNRAINLELSPWQRRDSAGNKSEDIEPMDKVELCTKAVCTSILRVCRAIHDEASPIMDAKLDELRSQPPQVMMRTVAQGGIYHRSEQLYALVEIIKALYDVVKRTRPVSGKPPAYLSREERGEVDCIRRRYDEPALITAIKWGVQSRFTRYCWSAARKQMLWALIPFARKFWHHICYRQTLDRLDGQQHLPATIEIGIVEGGRDVAVEKEASIYKAFMTTLISGIEDWCSCLWEQELVVVIRPWGDSFGALYGNAEGAVKVQDELNAVEKFKGGFRSVVVGNVITMDEMDEHWSDNWWSRTWKENWREKSESRAAAREYIERARADGRVALKESARG